MRKLSRSWDKSEGCSMESDYYIVLLNPESHKKTWNALKLVLTIAEAEYVVFYDYELDFMHLYPITKDEFKYYSYNPN